MQFRPLQPRRAQPQILRIGEHHRRRQRAARQQVLRAINIIQHPRQQRRPLHQSRLHRGEFCGLDQQRHRVAAPAQRRLARHHAGHSIIGKAAVQAPPTLRQRPLAQHGEGAHQIAPMRPQLAAAIHHLIHSLGGGFSHSGANPTSSGVPNHARIWAPASRRGCGQTAGTGRDGALRRHSRSLENPHAPARRDG